jgi:D-beta-D-heptose 7-phosphate kinase/D-beta-D-heptose 1-phosphate adenosyltransferase
MIPDQQALAGARVLLVGDVMLDRYWAGGTKRISPEAPVPVVDVDDFRELPGGAANVALNVASLGARATLIGMVGADEAADALRAGLDRAGVGHDLVTVSGSPTITKMRVLSRNQHLMRLDIEDGFAQAEHAPLIERVHAHLDGVDVVVISDYAKGTLGPATAPIIEAARAAGCRVLVDPKGDDFSAYRGAHLVTPNRGEFERVVGRCADSATLEERARALAVELDLEALLVTRSEEGMSLVPAEGAALHVAAHRREVYDVTGAGDTVIGVMAAVIGTGVGLGDAMRLANHAAAIVVARLGASQVTYPELRRAVETVDHPGDRRVVDADGLVAEAEAARARGERVVMTNGCFDLLHVGHLESLRAMRALGDRLVVAVNDDASVARLKGPQRPVTPLADRMAMLAALDCVDLVAPFSEDTPAALIARVRPDVLAKGGDYRPESIAGYDAVTAYGGEVRVVEYASGYSTTDLIARIRERKPTDAG